ncbi:MAG: DUF3612 domain-containing protein, partial [Gammaproteobacteria bacterium]|nr:DUF3612 domain-containing protein [Gammaproteobacteria bacterium]
MTGLTRQGHFLGPKLRGLRKRSGLTLEELSMRCTQLDAKTAPSTSYLSMIETGKRLPSREVLALLAGIFQKSPSWFLDENPDVAPVEKNGGGGGLAGVPLEPGFLFSKELLQSALPELLSQSGTTGKQFAHLLIRTHQELHRNEFPDLERSAEEIGQRRMPLSADELLAEYKRLGLEICWFDRKPAASQGVPAPATMLRSFYEPPNTVFINKRMQKEPERLKYELATYLGHKVLHDGDGQKSPHATTGPVGSSETLSTGMDTRDVLHAWRDFECSFFAGALLCPKLPFRSFLLREGYNVMAHPKLGVTPAVIMRRMTAVSPYRPWHYFDAYEPGFLRAVYRGNGIPLPWGNISLMTDPCPRWAVFDLLGKSGATQPRSQISIMPGESENRIYCCHSLRTKDAAGNPHVLSVGIDLLPALRDQMPDPEALIAALADNATQGNGQSEMSGELAHGIMTVSKVLNIHWLADALESPATIICRRSTTCPLSRPCR